MKRTKKLTSLLLACIMVMSLCVPAMATDKSMDNDDVVILCDETFETEVAMNAESAKSVSQTRTTVIIYTQLVVGYQEPANKLYVYIKHYADDSACRFYSATGTIRVVDVDSSEVIVSGHPYSMYSLLGATSIDTDEEIEDITLHSGQEITVTVNGSVGTNMQPAVVPITQATYCEVP